MKAHAKRIQNQNALYPYYRRPFPNAAEPTYFIDKLIDGVLAVATVMGALTIIFFLITM